MDCNKLAQDSCSLFPAKFWFHKRLAKDYQPLNEVSIPLN